MSIKDIEQFLNSSLTDLENDEKAAIYGESIEKYLDENGIDNDIVQLIIRGMDIDRGANFYDYLKQMPLKKLQNIWKIIRECKAMEDMKENGLKLLSGILFMALTNEGNIESISGHVITKICNMISAKGNPMPLEVFKPIFIEYIVNDFPTKKELPEWEKIKARPEAQKEFANLFLEALDSEIGSEQYHKFKNWLNKGIQYADAKIEDRNIQAKIPESKINDLKEIVQHYEEVEKLLHDYIYQEAALKKDFEKKEKEIAELEKTKREMGQEIKSLTDNVIGLQKEAEVAKQEIEDRKQLNAKQVHYREDSQASLLKDIADALRAEYEDYDLTKNSPMNEQMGELYREKLGNIFKILEQKGVKVKN